ncbi:hypothetical protein PDESU_03892 [Pontiella desulfatans]|uniref:Glycoside hydrolase family 42 N-terminal domain-containing protein n=2 Tax=Pontiella desulfatans TaxID=2750659 RepID=A0A6C2U5M9_PONDE|nr:hypothetical protein PDESU_03892 [Pontiella desulfatans]
MKRITALVAVLLSAPCIHAETDDGSVIGSVGYIHVEKLDGVWWLVNAEGERFVATGMNHVSPRIRFASYNKEHWIKEFGEGILRGKGVDWKAPEVNTWMEQVAKDHRDYGFNTIAFHHPREMPTEYFEELGIHYFGKLKLGEINHKHTHWHGGFPDVFSPEWKTKAEVKVKAFAAKHKNNKHLLGYSFNDLPDYSLEAYLRIREWEMKREVYELHPWIKDIISKPGSTEGKKLWVDMLKRNHASAEEAGANYGVDAVSWEELAASSDWKTPEDRNKGTADQREMCMRITEAWLKTHHDLIRKYDPNHLILGDKISAHGLGQPDWVWDIVKKYVDVVLIQDYDFYTREHEEKLKGIHRKTGLPIINGDHAYGCLRPNMKKNKGIPVENLCRVGEEYARYLQGIMGLPFMLGWQNCGYLEQWSGGENDNTGAEQCGLFDPFGKPLMDALRHVKQANRNAVKWHEGTMEK